MTNFPFTAIVGLDKPKRSLIYHSIDPRIGGVLLAGDRGCAKSTLARAFAEILPSESGEATPFVEVPLGATEDRLLGSIDPQRLVGEGRWEERRGLIEEADGGVLYIDEVNLLPDALADTILDSAATGEFHLEREGMRRHVRSRYILVGTMNPEEGELRPQLADRFAHTVPVRTDFSAEDRVRIVEQRLQFEEDPDAFLRAHEASLSELKAHIAEARAQRPKVGMTSAQKLQIAQWAERAGIEGLRRELAVIRTACCAAAWEGRTEVSEADIKEAWELCVGASPQQERESGERPAGPQEEESGSDGPGKMSGGGVSTSAAPREARRQSIEVDSMSAASSEWLRAWMHETGTNRTKTANRATMRRGAEVASQGTQIAWLESLKASCRNGWPRRTRQWALRYHRVKRRPILWIFLDASRSVGMHRFLGQARSTLEGLLRHVKRCRVSLLVLQGGDLYWGGRRVSARHAVDAIRRIDFASGKSEIAAALDQLRRAIANAMPKEGDRVLLLTDGLNSPRNGESPRRAQQRTRDRLKRLADLKVPTLWVHPQPRRGLKRWLADLSRGIPVKGMAIGRGRR